jgi:hypothetical protein
MVDSYSELGYRYSGLTVPTEVASDALGTGGELNTFLKPVAESKAESGVVAGARNLLTKGAWYQKFATALGTIAASATAFQVGWSIGEAIDGFFGIGGSDAGAYEPTYSTLAPKSYKAVDAGDPIATVNCGGNAGTDFCVEKPKASMAGFVIIWEQVQGPNVGYSTTYLGECLSGKYCNKGQVLGQPAGAEEVRVLHYSNANGEGVGDYWFIPARMQGRSPEGGVDVAGVSQPAATPPTASVARKAAEEVLKSSAPEDEEFNAWAFHHGARPSGVSESDVADPLAPKMVGVPVACHVGGQRSSCVAALQELEVVPEITELTWSTAVLPAVDPTEPETAREEGANQITEVPSPLPSEIEKGSEFAFSANPGLASMPVVIPSPLQGETYAEYAARLNPALNPVKHVVGEVAEDPSTGPEGVIRTAPSTGTRVDPATSTSVAVDVNPDNAPIVPEGGGGFVPPNVPAIQLPGAGLSPCGVFPFGLFCWVKEAVSELNVSPRCPSADVPLGVQDETMELGICKVPEVEKWIGYWRTLVVFMFSIGCAWTFARATGAIGGGDAEEA